MKNEERLEMVKSGRWWKKRGPGLITGAADDDPSVIAGRLVAVMMAASHTKIVGDLKLPTPWRALGWLATAAMAAATLVMFATMF